MPDTLFCIMPAVSLWRRYPYIEPPFGSSLVAGGLVGSGRSVVAYNLEAQINHLRAEGKPIDVSTLAKLEDWRSAMRNPGDIPPDLGAILDQLMDIVQPDEFRHVALSLNRVTNDRRVHSAALGFALVFAHRMKERCGTSITVGGQILDCVGADAFVEAAREAPTPLFDHIFYDDGAIALPMFLEAMDGDGAKSRELREFLRAHGQRLVLWPKAGQLRDIENRAVDACDLQKPDASLSHSIRSMQLKILPSFDVANRELYLKSPSSILPTMNEKGWTHKPTYILPYKFIAGCTHRCAFCKSANDAPSARTPADVVGDLEHIVDRYGVRNFRFFNSQINFSEEYAEEFCREIIGRGLAIQFSDSCSLRNLSPKTCRLLRQAGCVKLWFGIESPSDRILSLVNKGLDVSTMHDSIMNAHNSGIWIGANTIVGFPHETDDEFKSLLAFIWKYREVIDCWVVSPLELYEDTPMFLSPGSYGIEVHGRYPPEAGIRGYAFSEIGGLPWDERQKQSVRRADLCYEVIGGTRNRFASNDFLTFAIYDRYHEKSKVKEMMKRYFKRTKRHLRLHDAARWITVNDVHGFDSDRIFGTEPGDVK